MNELLANPYVQGLIVFLIGYFLKAFFPNLPPLPGPVAPPAPAPSPVLPLLPGLPNGMTVEQLLAMLLAALRAKPPQDLEPRS